MNGRVDEAKELFGSDIVNTVTEMVDMSDPDGMYTTFQDMGMFEHSECVEFIYFN